MIHAHEKFNRIQDPENKIGADEPVFLLRANDIYAPDTLRYWADRVAVGGRHPNSKLAEDIRIHAEEMEKWQQENGCIIPD